MKLKPDKEKIKSFMKAFIIICCAYFTVSYIIYGHVSYLRAVIFSILFATTVVLMKEKKKSAKIS